MWVFVSYAAEDRDIAERVDLALNSAGYHTFFDRANLPVGQDYHKQIERAVERSDALVFLASPDSTAPGSYALTELKYARTKWRHPKSHVIPVRIRNVSWEAMPNYLKAVTVLDPEGNIEAEVLQAISELQNKAGSSRDGSRASVMSESKENKDQDKVKIFMLVAIIGLLGTLGAGVIANWDKLISSFTRAIPTLPQSFPFNVAAEFEQYKQTTLPIAEFSSGRGPRLTEKKQIASVYAYNNANSPYTKGVDILSIIADLLEEYMQNTVRIVRKHTSEPEHIALKEEMKLYKFFGGAFELESGISSSDYMIVITITSLDAESTYQGLPKTEESTRPAQCVYVITITGTLRIYSIAEGKSLQAIFLRGKGSKKENTTNAVCTIREDMSQFLLRHAVEDAIDGQKQQFSMYKEEKIGYIFDKRVNKKQAIFQVSLGKKDGIGQGIDLEIYTRFLYENPLTKESSMAERKVARGKATDYVGDDFVWIIIPNESEANQIRLGDHVKVLYK